jgi:putative flippase GtrA|tara:strand:- start:365 stop:787 length:423 start_codon:yes stop_codon:yes gene_type:complete
MKKLLTLKFGKSVFKFGLGSVVATVVDLLLFVFVFSPILSPFYAYLAAAAIGISVNFLIQKLFIFEMKKSVYSTFLLSVSASIITTFIGAFLIEEFVGWSILTENLEETHVKTAAYILVTGIRFFLNFFSKKYIFERKFV